jgi:hypothetical protein
VHVGKPIIATLKPIDQSLVVQAQQVQHGGLQVVDVDRIPDDIIAKVIRFAISFSWTNSGPRQPDGKAPRMMIPAII